VQAAGKTDPEIARAILLQSGVSADRIDARWSEFKHVAAEEYAARVDDDLSAFLAPGAVDVLDALAARDDVVLSLVTGNLEAIARLKLARAGIGRFFARGQGGFGSDHEDRSELPAIARARAGRPGEPYPREDTIVIGDTPLDVACARADGLRCFAVATGPFRAEELGEADEVVATARELLALLAP
jgi:phosphoglycolate phosphatase-like HAD superfamily hydrolase